MKRFYSLSVCVALGFSMAHGKEAVMNDLSQWMESAMVGRPEAVPKKNDLLKKSEIDTEQKLMWKTYKRMAVRLGWDKHLLPTPEPIEETIKKGEKVMMKRSTITSGAMEMPYVFIAKGKKPANGWPLFISLHGGGRYTEPDLTGPHGWPVNTSEWQAQMRLTMKVYKPAGLYFIPRMAHDRWGRWWMKHNIDIFTRMIRDAILFNDVDPNRIYIMGISQGGYGTCHLAPFLADELAAAGAMAGGMMTVTENLRNLPFRSDIGEKDTMYDRINLANKLHTNLDTLKKVDPNGYENVLAIQKGRGHGIDYSKSPSWLETHSRNPYPEKVVWRCFTKDGIYRDNFYWLSLTETPKTGEFEIVASLDKKQNKITLTAYEVVTVGKDKEKSTTRKPLEAAQVIVHLNDAMLDLDKKIMIELNGKEVFNDKVERSRGSMMQNLVKRGDINYAFPVDITVGTRK